jgi:crotonobetainyl-CoA:carnitine CoA-transferase CaiB-like acyl-CoA transferase
MVDRFEHPLLGSFPFLKVPFKFKGLDAPKSSAPPLLGEHTQIILQRELGMKESEIQSLREEKII